MNEEKASIYKKSYYLINKRAILNYNNFYCKKRRKTDPVFRLRLSISSAIKRAFNGKKEGKSILNYLGYDLDSLKLHLEKQFEPWMNWDNYGSFSQNHKTWQIDHIIPQSKLPYTSMEDDNFKKCWALENLRPLESFLNMKKGNRIV